MSPGVQLLRMFAALSLAVVSACGPIGPTLSGVVYEVAEEGPLPVVGATVENRNTHAIDLTDANGVYRVPVSRGRVMLWVSKGRFFQKIEVTVQGSRQLDVQLVRRAQTRRGLRTIP